MTVHTAQDCGTAGSRALVAAMVKLRTRKYLFILSPIFSEIMCTLFSRCVVGCGSMYNTRKRTLGLDISNVSWHEYRKASNEHAIQWSFWRETRWNAVLNVKMSKTAHNDIAVESYRLMLNAYQQSHSLQTIHHRPRPTLSRTFVHLNASAGIWNPKKVFRAI